MMNSMQAKITKKLKEIYFLENLNPLFVYKFLQNCRIIIANYIRTLYQLDPLAYSDAHDIVAVDESLFSHLNDEQIWYVGLINLRTNDIRLEVVENRSSQTLKTIIEKHVMNGNTIVTDNWTGYNFLDNANSGYYHIKYNHSNGNLGYSNRIEGVWGELKALFKKIYSSIRSKNLLYFMREMEFRRLIKNLNLDNKLKKFSEIIECVGNGIKEKLLTDDQLSSLNYDTFFDD